MKNERIWDLFKQSGIDIGDDQESNIEKFAELVWKDGYRAGMLRMDEAHRAVVHDISNAEKPDPSTGFSLFGTLS